MVFDGLARRVVVYPPEVDGGSVRFRWDVTPPTPLYLANEFTLTFPDNVDMAAIPHALWSHIAVICLHAQWPLLRPCVVTLPFEAPPPLLEAWSRLLESECWTLDAFAGSPYRGLDVRLEPGEAAYEPLTPLPASNRCATAFSGGRDSLVQAAMLAEFTERPLLVTTTSRLPPLEDHHTPRRRHVLEEIARRRDVEVVEVTSDFRATWNNVISRREGLPVSVNEVSDTFLYFAALLAVAVSRGAPHLFVAGEAEVQANVEIEGRTIQYEQYMYSVATQRALARLLDPLGVSYGSLVSPLYHHQLMSLLVTRYCDLRDLQYSCWNVPKGEAACSNCNYCFGNAIFLLANDVAPGDTGIDLFRVLRGSYGKAPFPDPIRSDLPTFSSDREIDAERAVALLRIPRRRIARELLRISPRRLAREGVSTLRGMERHRTEARRYAPFAPTGYRAGFVPLIDPLLEPEVRRVIETAFNPGEDDGAAARSDALTRWIVAPLEAAVAVPSGPGAHT